MPPTDLVVEAIYGMGDGIAANISFLSDEIAHWRVDVDDNPGFTHFISEDIYLSEGGRHYDNDLPNRLYNIISVQPELTPGRWFLPERTYYWRIADTAASSGWGFVEGPVINTPSLRVYATIPDLLSVQVPAQSEGLYGALFGWADWAPVGWRLDVTGDPDFNVFDSYDIGNMDYLTIESMFSPDTTYYWRIFDGTDFYPGDSFSVPFGVPPDELIDQFVYILDPETSVPVNEPQDLQDIPEAHIGAKLRTAADAIRQARARMRGFTVGGTPL